MPYFVKFFLNDIVREKNIRCKITPNCAKLWEKELTVQQRPSVKHICEAHLKIVTGFFGKIRRSCAPPLFSWLFDRVDHINQIKREEQRVVNSIKQLAKKNDTTSAKILARGHA